MKLAARYSGQTVLAVGAHADDVELAVGGTMARLRRAGARVVMAVVSLPGDYKMRLREAEHAASILGCELRILMEGGSRRNFVVCGTKGTFVSAKLPEPKGRPTRSALDGPRSRGVPTRSSSRAI